jgi:uncharacterized protein YyaL (SSP411 family)
MSEHPHTNRLIDESSPYLLQHAHNPVDWYPWGEEALERARRDDLPILLSIGYSACHWCHVMERESFENADIAQLMNERFVNIKVDREERPDLDQIYMNAVQMMTGHGGWPLTVFLTPGLVPFYGGTYFPPQDRYQMPGFKRVLISISDAYRTQPAQVAESAQQILSELKRSSSAQESSHELTSQLLDQAVETIKRSYDSSHGGFGAAPKFPASMSLEFLLRAYYRTGDVEALEVVKHTCRKMAEGGIYDQLGGGFHRYSTDARWLVPHFEKMLYDNALLSRLYLHVYQITSDDFFRRIAEETLDYVKREMTDESGAFYSTQDADSEGVEGKFFVWSRDEIVQIVGAEAANIFCAYFDVSERGNFEGHNILNIPRAASEVAEELNITLARLYEVIEQGRKMLYKVRESRIKPARDEKTLTAWNGLMLTSFAEAAAILNRDDYRRIAERNAQFILVNLKRDRFLLHVSKSGRAKLYGYLDDYSFIISGLITLFETTGDLQWLQESVELSEQMIGEFWDVEEGGFFYTGKSGEKLIVRHKDFFDNAIPSGYSVAIETLLRLGVLTDNENYRRKSTSCFRLIHHALERHPSAFGYTLGALDFYLSSPKEIVLVGYPDEVAMKMFGREIWRRYMPNKVVVTSTSGDTKAGKLLPLLKDKTTIEGKATAYVCVNYSCGLPVHTGEALAVQLDG